MKSLFRSLFCILALLIASGASRVTAQSNPAEPADPEAKLKEMKIELPAPSKPIATYSKYVRTGNLIYFAGEGPRRADGSVMTGKLGKDFTVEQGYEAARLTGINLLATLKDAIGDLRKVRKIVKVLGVVNCTEDFGDQPKVVNGFSDLMVEVFGENGRHARSAVGASGLPLGIPVEVEMIVEVE
jgi:enamine deaminase RidA (YjgF/YER057c/UK114 family)